MYELLCNVRSWLFRTYVTVRSKVFFRSYCEYKLTNRGVLYWKYNPRIRAGFYFLTYVNHHHQKAEPFT